MKNTVFDKERSIEINIKRQEWLNTFLPELIDKYKIASSLDVGCGVGMFSSYLNSLELRVVGTDVRDINVEEAKQRFPDIHFEKMDIERIDTNNIGTFDLVLCVGLLYHLENPFMAIRNLFKLTDKVSVIEAMATPSKLSVATLIDEGSSDDQGSNYVALIPSESTYIKMLKYAGFKYIYKTGNLPDHPEFMETDKMHVRRIVLIASKKKIDMDNMKLATIPKDIGHNALFVKEYLQWN